MSFPEPIYFQAIKRCATFSPSRQWISLHSRHHESRICSRWVRDKNTATFFYVPYTNNIIVTSQLDIWCHETCMNDSAHNFLKVHTDQSPHWGFDRIVSRLRLISAVSDKLCVCDSAHNDISWPKTIRSGAHGSRQMQCSIFIYTHSICTSLVATPRFRVNTEWIEPSPDQTRALFFPGASSI